MESLCVSVDLVANDSARSSLVVVTEEWIFANLLIKSDLVVNENLVIKNILTAVVEGALKWESRKND